jgi:hypothetical protein
MFKGLDIGPEGICTNDFGFSGGESRRATPVYVLSPGGPLAYGCSCPRSLF